MPSLTCWSCWSPLGDGKRISSVGSELRIPRRAGICTSGLIITLGCELLASERIRLECVRASRTAGTHQQTDGHPGGRGFEHERVL